MEDEPDLIANTANLSSLMHVALLPTRRFLTFVSFHAINEKTNNAVNWFVLTHGVLEVLNFSQVRLLLCEEGQRTRPPSSSTRGYASPAPMLVCRNGAYRILSCGETPGHDRCANSS